MEVMRQDKDGCHAWIDRVAPFLTGLVWTVPLVVITIGIVNRPGQRSLDPIYRWAVDAWLAHEPLYSDERGFIYLPTFIPIYLSIAKLPVPAGEILWRAIATAGIAHGLWSLMKVSSRPRSARGFLLLSIACLPVSLGALQMGQANAWIAMSLFQAAAAISRESPWRAAAWLGLGFAIKPIVIPAIALAVIRSRCLALPVTTVSAAFLVLPFLTAPHVYVWEQYASSLGTIAGPCASVTEHRFADINGLLRSLGIPLDPRWSNILSLVAGLTLAVATGACGACHSAHRWSLLWLSLSCSYLLLFNPMTEANSYCLIGVPAALLAWEWLGRGEDPKERHRTRYLITGWMSIAMLLVMGSASEIARPWLGNSLDLWLFPCCGLAFGMAAVFRLVTRVA
jgi:alpha-1,2-mannosyltransferase